MSDELTSSKQLMTERLILEPLVVEHARLLYKALSDGRLYRFVPQVAPSSLEALAERYRKLTARSSPDGNEIWLNFALRLRDFEETASDSYVGTLEATVYPDHAAHIAYFVFPSFWRRGFAREGCQRLLAYLKLDYEVVKVIAEIDTRNTASLALVESLGFKRVDTNYEADYFKGSNSDEFIYELGI